jgi:hypothetical protein
MRSRMSLAAGLAGLAALCPAAASAAPTFTDFSAGSGAYAIAGGADRNVWFTDDAHPGAISAITPTGTVSAFTAGLTHDGRGRDRHGKYRSHGRNSAATVRGTEWSTRETCVGTVTRVMRGSVSVRETRSGRTTIVRAGHLHLAPSRP